MIQNTKLKIPIQIEWLRNEKGKEEIEFVMNSNDFFKSAITIRKSISTFKIMYKDFIRIVEKIQKSSEKKHGKRELSTTDTWKLSKLLSEFNDKVENEFLIVNFKEAFSRDLGISTRYVELYLYFGKYFEESEVLDSIPLSFYTEMCLRKTSLMKLGLFEKEKKWLVNRGRAQNLPNHYQYRQHLIKVLDNKFKTSMV